jgi:SAM-dependent methyltransferase
VSLHEAVWGRVAARERDALLAGARGRVLHLGAGGGDGAVYDTVVSLFTLCTAPDLPEALAGVRRLLAPDGCLLFLEHVAARSYAVAGVQHALDPLWSRATGGCHLDRDTIGAMRAAGLVVTDCERPPPFGRASAGMVVCGRAILRRGT